MRIAVLDDNSETMNLIVDLLKKNRPDWEVFCYGTPFALVTGIYDELKGDLDLAIVKLKESNDERIEMMKDLQNYFPHIMAVFYSDKTECAEFMFRAIPTYFMKLPLTEEKVSLAIDRVEKLFNEDINQTLVIRLGGKIQKLKFSALRYIESLGRKLIFYTESGAYEANMKMESIMEKLPECFCRVHRSYIVNLNYIDSIVGGSLVLYNGEEIPVSRTNYQMVKERLCRSH